MGSPEDEPVWFDSELLHPVTLTQGYWLAEAASPQALWDAVIGSNPSEFKGSDRPVETVSWENVKHFIEQLNDKLPDLQGRLPHRSGMGVRGEGGQSEPVLVGLDSVTGAGKL